MQTTTKKLNDVKTKRTKPPKDEVQKPQDEKLTKTSHTTPRNYTQKSSTSDIYGRNKKDSIQDGKAPKKQPNTHIKASYVSPMKGLLQSSPSSTSFSSSSREKTKTGVKKKVEAKTYPHSSTKVKDFNVTVNSPVVKRRLDKEKSFNKESHKKATDLKINPPQAENKNIDTESVNERKRTKTRTLHDDEVKILTAEAVDNNLEMFNLSRKLSAAPKTFYIDLDDDKAKHIKKQPPRPKTPSDEDISYEDDFESYESDFDSYHSSTSNQSANDDKDEEKDDDHIDEVCLEEVELKEVKDEEKMLDSGSFHLRDQRSATKTKPVLDFILETVERGEDKGSSLTDEGFQEMSSSSAVSSIRIVHTDVIDRPLFLDFTKSQENKRKKKINERLKQRANDLLSIITLHEMSYSLFEMQPISYDLFMATFGKSNNQQVGVQTFDDGITEEIQTDEIECEHKWTQYPVEFSKNDICIVNDENEEKFNKNNKDYVSKFTFLTTDYNNIAKNNVINLDENYKLDPLRIYLEQKDGVGPNELLPYEIYNAKLKNNDYNSHRLSKFLKKIERRVCNVMNSNSGDLELSEMKISKYPFSKGYIAISTKNITKESLLFLNNTIISKVYLSESKSNLLLTVHNTLHTAIKKCVICLWDINIARREPIKILTAIDNVAIGKFRGTTDGYFVAALVDGSIHLWDLAEEPMWRDVASAEKKDLVEISDKELTPLERDREWNKNNSQVGIDDCNIHCALQSCAFTNSAYNMNNGDASNKITGLEFTSNQVINQEGRRLLGQVVALQTVGILTIWSIIQEKSKTIPPDIGRAYWSKMKMEKYQEINLIEHINIPMNGIDNIDFNLNAAKRRLISRKQEKVILKTKNARPKSSVDIDRPCSAASVKNKKVLQVHKNVGSNWESGILCYDLKVVFWQNSDCYLIAKNFGEVLYCKKKLGAIRVSRFTVATDASSVTCLEVSPHNLPYYITGTDTGTISICSMLENRVLLTLDCRNNSNRDSEKCLSDNKGRFITTVSNTSAVTNDTQFDAKRISSLSWSRVNPCCIFATLDGSIVTWDLCNSDIYAKCISNNAANSCTASDNTLALVTLDEDIQIHKLTNENKTNEYLMLFNKYVTLL